MEEDEWETPTSIDATEPRLEVEAVPDDEGIMPDAAAGVGRALTPESVRAFAKM